MHVRNKYSAEAAVQRKRNQVRGKQAEPFVSSHVVPRKRSTGDQAFSFVLLFSYNEEYHYSYASLITELLNDSIIRCRFGRDLQSVGMYVLHTTWNQAIGSSK